LPAGASQGELSTIQLPNPCTGQLQGYICTDDSVREVQRYKQRFSSWFVDSNVVSGEGSAAQAASCPLHPLP
jgi:hypothetical protein